MTTITRGSSSVTPLLITGYKSTRKAGNIIHPIISRADPDVTLKAAGLRTGTLVALCSSHAQALQLEDINAGEGVCQLVDVDVPALGMYYVASGNIELELEDETRSRWLVSVDFTEVLP